MKNYKKVLVAVELIEKNDAELIKRAEFVINEFKTDVILVHAVELVGGYREYGIGVGFFEVENALMDAATSEMKRLGDRLGVPRKNQIVKVGSAKFIILEEAEKNKTDLIIVGSHGRHGIRMILGSTANAVLHDAKSDVLAVRFKD